MEALTKKQRREIYLKVAERVINRDGAGLCHLVTAPIRERFDTALSLYPELALFKPNRIEDTSNNRWWMNDDDGSRIICMLLCAEMCKS